MKIKVAYCLLCFLLVFCIPMAAVGFELVFPYQAAQTSSSDTNMGESKNAETEEPSDSSPEKEDKAQAVASGSFELADGGELRIKSESTGAVTEVSLYDYTLGAIAAEMPPDFHLEALKA